MPVVNANGINIYYEIHPAKNPKAQSDKTPLLLIMGMGLNSLSWHKNLPDLTAERTVIVFDNRGTGRSSKPDHPYSTRQMAADAAGLLDVLRIRRAHVFGFSLGSLVAQEMALHFTHKVKGLILGASSAGSFQHVMSSPAVYQTMVQRGWVNPEVAAEVITPIIYSHQFIASQPEKIRADKHDRLVYPTPPYAYRRQLMAAFNHNAYFRLDHLPMPTLLMTGSKDLLVIPENSARLARRIPRAELKVLPGAGHYFTSEQPQQMAHAVSDFLSRHFSSVAHSEQRRVAA
ncbi:MAG TPA: alpha/beta hydrolase [Chloroflexia bacterium]|nr:alpha/beta hydrolase [Chloroflexia bacterium]